MQKPLIIQIVGDQGAGKSTVAKAIYRLLLDSGKVVHLIDGDSEQKSLGTIEDITIFTVESRPLSQSQMAGAIQISEDFRAKLAKIGVQLSSVVYSSEE